MFAPKKKKTLNITSSTHYYKFFKQTKNCHVKFLTCLCGINFWNPDRSYKLLIGSKLVAVMSHVTYRYSSYEDLVSDDKDHSSD